MGQILESEDDIVFVTLRMKRYQGLLEAVSAQKQLTEVYYYNAHDISKKTGFFLQEKAKIVGENTKLKNDLHRIRNFYYYSRPGELC